jgi:hypothetical protein
MKRDEAYYGYKWEVSVDDVTVRVREAIPLKEKEQMA